MSAIHISNEIIESQKARSELLKWKIIVVSILATAGLGVSKDIEKLELAFCIIPLVCAYVDALCLHLNLRIFTIGKWHSLELGKDLDDEYTYMKYYEKFTDHAYQCGAYRLEKWTILYSSLLINAIIAIAPFLKIAELAITNRGVVSSFGAFGLLLTLLLNRYLRITKNSIDSLSDRQLVGDKDR